MMKGQDILLLLKLASLENQKAAAEQAAEQFSMRALEQSTGISKSEVSNALNRCIAAGLAKLERNSGIPRANTRALDEFLGHGLKYVFPVRPGPLVRGLATAHAAPVLAGKLLSGGEHIYVWEDAQGSDMGQAIEPLFKSVPSAARQDEALYAMLALVDAIRLGNEREASVARTLLTQQLRDPADGS
jgi:DNA-binding transcriptional ArsR family regulator